MLNEKSLIKFLNSKLTKFRKKIHKKIAGIS